MSVDWRVFALASAVFAALTAIVGKLGVAGASSSVARSDGLFESIGDRSRFADGTIASGAILTAR